MVAGSGMTATDNPVHPQSHTGRNFAVVIVVLLLVVVVAFLIFRTSVGTQLTYPNVLVSGTVSTLGIGTHPIRIDFASPSGQVYSAQVNNGQYSISLPNNQDYSVTVTGAGALGYTGSCSGGSLNLNVLASSDSFSTSC
jgi:hypothetical protein